MKKLISIFSFIGFAFHANATQLTLSKTITDANCNGANDGRIQIGVSGGVSPYTFSWSSGQTTSTINGLSPGSYTVHIFDSQSNDTIISMTISEKTCEVAAENLFTPNGDGINDTWTIFNLEYYPDFLVIVYNRWGQKVFEQSGTYTPWDGTEHGVGLPDATYYFTIYKDKSKKDEVIKGNVTIIR